jgi:hypothetical protein
VQLLVCHSANIRAAHSTPCAASHLCCTLCARTAGRRRQARLTTLTAVAPLSAPPASSRGCNIRALSTLPAQEQKAAASCLRTLAFKNDDNKNRIVDCGALPLLVTMLHSDERELHYEAVGAIGNLVHSAPYIKRRVLEVSRPPPLDCSWACPSATVLCGNRGVSDACERRQAAPAASLEGWDAP